MAPGNRTIQKDSEMSILLDPLEEDQKSLIRLVWSRFQEEGAQWPCFNYVDFFMRKQGLDARSVIGGLPTIGKLQYHGGYAPAGYLSSGGIPTANSTVYLTMAGLFHIPHPAMPIISTVLAYLRQMTRIQEVIAHHPFDVPDVTVSLREAMMAEGLEEKAIPWAAAIAEHEWPAMQSSRRKNPDDAFGRLSLLGEANFHTIEEYLLAITAVTTPQQATTILDYRDPRVLLRTIDHFDVTCELVLKQPLVVRPSMGRSALLAQDAQSHGDLLSGLSALGEIIGELRVPGRDPNYATGRLLSWLSQELPKLTQAACTRIQSAIDLLDAVRDIRNSGQHPKPKKQLIAAHELLGLSFPIQDPQNAWDIIRAQVDVAFETLQEEILAAR
jgi:hypothetical protein